MPKAQHRRTVRPDPRHARPPAVPVTPAIAGITMGSAAFMAVTSVAAAPAAAAARPAAQAQHVAAAAELIRSVTTRASVSVVTVQHGNTLSGIAAQHGTTWQHLAAINHLADPNLIYPGQRIRLTGTVLTTATPRHTDPFDGKHGKCGDGDYDGFDMDCALLHHTAAPGLDGDGDHDGDHGDGGGAAVAAPASTGPVSTAGMSAFERCVIARESGGNPRAVNPQSGAGGTFQFLLSTWNSLGLGYPGGAQTAPESVQERGFAIEFARNGVRPWQPSDGCH